MSVAIPIPLLQHLPDVNVTPAVGVDEYALVYDHDTTRFVLRAPAAGVTDHGALTGLTPDDDHAQYALLAGRAGGQTLYGDTAANGDITIHGTSNATRTTSYVLLQPTAGNVGIGTTSPATALHVVGAATITGGIRPAADSTTALQLQTAAGAAVVTVDTTNARVGIGTTAPGASLDVGKALSSGSTGLKVNPAIALALAIGETFGQQVRPIFTASIDQTTSVLYGSSNVVYTAGNYAYSAVYALQGIFRHDGGGTVSRADALNVQMGIGSGGGTVTSLYGINISSFKSSGTIATLYGLKIGNQSAGNTNYSIFSEGGTMYHAGNVGIKDTAPAEALDVNGNANVTGVYKVDDVQVLSNRVIDARCASVANSGDATTDGLIDALRDAMVAHGLIAAA